jgi:hypothetical protein
MAKVNKTKQEIFKKGAKIARESVLGLCTKGGVTAAHTILRLKEAMDAEEQNVTYDSFRGRWEVGPKQVAHRIRLDGVKLSTALLDMMPEEKLNVTVTDLAGLIRDARKRVKDRP